MESQIRKVAVVGNSCAGKTTLSRKLAKLHSLPLVHVDSIQFLPGLKIRPYSESIEILTQIQEQQEWLIDGYGPLDIIQARFKKADRIIFIDFPLWRHYWWGLRRQVKNLWSRREELPDGCDELSLKHIIKLYKTLWRVHHQMRPELLRIFAREEFKMKMIYVRNLQDWNTLAKKDALR